jgi:rhodanese-related sulfurtransferase/lysophospholipase L1-like esterase
MNFGDRSRALVSIAVCLHALAGPASPSVAPRGRTIAVLGSSVAAGWVTAREAGQDMKNGWAFRLARRLEPLGYKVVNVSAPGDTTEKVLARLDKDLFSLKPDIVVISLSLENEGIRGLGGRDPEKVYEGFGTNLRRIVAECRERGITPVVASCYANDNFGDPAIYRFIVGMSLEIASWDVPSINLLGALDRGDGRFIKGLTFDLDHPADRGHRELFLSIVPGLFEALAAGKPAPERDSGPGYFSSGTPGRSRYLSCVPADPMHSFTSLFEIRASGPGVAASIRAGDGKSSTIAVTENGDAALHASTGAVQRVPASLLDGKWHRIGWVYHYLKQEATLYVDGVAGGSIAEAGVPVQFLLGGSGRESQKGRPAAAAFRDWMIYRVPLSVAEIEAIQSGRVLPGSLEVFAPLRRDKPKVDAEVENRAQSGSRVVVRPRNVGREIARLETAIARQDREEIVYIDPNEKKPVFVAPEIQAAWTGVYEIAPGLTLTVVMEEGRLFLLVNGGDEGKAELFPLSAERFFVRSVGPQMEVSFQAEKSGQPATLVFKAGGQEMKGTRKGLAGIKDVSCQQALEIIREYRRNPDFAILDFRTEAMFVESHIPGAISHDVFLKDIDDWLRSLDRKKVYLIYCTSGHRSGIALAKMKETGFVNILHMNEGISRWNQLGYGTVSEN